MDDAYTIALTVVSLAIDALTYAMDRLALRRRNISPDDISFVRDAMYALSDATSHV